MTAIKISYSIAYLRHTHKPKELALACEQVISNNSFIALDARPISIIVGAVFRRPLRIYSINCGPANPSKSSFSSLFQDDQSELGYRICGVTRKIKPFEILCDFYSINIKQKGD